MDLAACRRHAGVPRDHLDAALHRFFQHRYHGVRIVGGNGDRIHPLGDQPVQHVDLRLGGGSGRAGVDHFDIT